MSDAPVFVTCLDNKRIARYVTVGDEYEVLDSFESYKGPVYVIESDERRERNYEQSRFSPPYSRWPYQKKIISNETLR